MAACATCGATIVLGGVKHGAFRYCNAKCASDTFGTFERLLPPELIEAQADEIRRGRCPVCSGEGPIEFHSVHFVWSAVVVSRHGTKTKLCCLACCRKWAAAHLAGCAVFGWWSIHGLIITPIQIGRNITAMMSGDPPTASRRLRRLAAVQLAQRSSTEPARTPATAE